MTKKLLFLLTILPCLSFAQPNTDVFLFDLKTSNNIIELSNNRNISANDGYDNQPSFLDSNTIVYVGTRNGQTDIVKYNINYDSKIFINHTEGGEYSPLKIPNKNEVSAVRLDPDGKQRLYTYDLRNGESTELVKDLVVAYYTWFDDNTIICAAIEENGLNLFIVNVKENTSKKLQENVGRSFHKIPNSDLVSFISKENDVWQIKSLNPKTGYTRVIANTIESVEDISWINSQTILSGKESVLYKLTLRKDNNWKQVADLRSKGISKITRLATNPESNMLLIAGDVEAITSETKEKSIKPEETTQKTNTTKPEAAELVVKQMMEAYNKRDIDKYMSFYSDNVKLYNYPNEISTNGSKAMRESYTEFFKNTPDLNGYVKSRIVHGNKVIDNTQVTINGKMLNAIAIYEINNNKISRVTFIY